MFALRNQINDIKVNNDEICDCMMITKSVLNPNTGIVQLKKGMVN